MGPDTAIILVALLSGAVSVLTPCVLVMLPVILAFAGGEGRRRVWGILLGIEVSFIGISLLLGAAISALGLPPRTQEFGAAVIILAFGIVLLVPALRHRFEVATSRATSRVPGAGRGGDGFSGGLVGGLGLGLVWAPCAGPILAFVTAAGNTGGFGTRSVMIALAYGLGMLFPLLAVLKGGRALVDRIRRHLGARRLDVAMGSIMIVMGVVILSGGQTTVNRVVAEKVNLTSTPIAGLEKRALGQAKPAEEVKLASSGKQAPSLGNVGKWHNLKGGKERLTAADLKGKVVVYDFWTYTCINCIRTLPALRKLQAKYADQGLVIIGVHTPEFEFEKDEGNVAKAIVDLDVTWPVVTDRDYVIWKRFDNHYWPAKYITNRDGEIVYTHVGEGGYDETERTIRALLGETATPQPAATDAEEAAVGAAAGDPSPSTPETYLGYSRLAPAQWRGAPKGGTVPGVLPDARATYVNTAARANDMQLGLGADQYSLVGPWRVEGDRAIAAGPGARILLHYRARKVYLVLERTGAASGGTVRIADHGARGARPHEMEVTAERLYTLRDATVHGDGLLELDVPAGVASYAFTFG